MKDLKAAILESRLRSIKLVMERAERSAADVHEMDNIRHCAQAALDLLECDRKDADTLEPIVCRLEKRTAELFKKRFQGRF